MRNLLKWMAVLPVIMLSAYTLPTIKPSGKQAASKYEALLNLYQPVTITTFRVFSTTNFYDDTYKFKGKQIDDSMVSLLPQKMLSTDDGASYFATYKFAIDANRTGLLTRSPGQYDASSIKLLIYDKQKDAITDFFQIAEKWHDAGDTFEAVSWLYKNTDKTLNCVLWEESVHDGKLDDEADTTRKVSIHYYLLGFKKAVHDTLSRDAKAIFTKLEAKK